MDINRTLKKYSLEFIVVFLGILSSFAIDNYLEAAQKVDQKNLLLDELYLSINCLLYTSPSPRDLSTSRMPSSA